MKKHMKLFSFLLALTVTASSAGCSLSGKKDSSTSSSVLSEDDEGNEGSADGAKADEKKTDGDIRPQDDFYGYVNYATLKDAEIPYGQYGTSVFMDESDESPSEKIVKEIGKSDRKYAPGTNEQLIHDIYAQAISYKDDGTAEKEIMANCDRILNAGNISELMSVYGDLTLNYGSPSIFQFEVMHDYKDSSRYAMYLYPMQSFLGTSLESIHDEISKCEGPNNIARDMFRIQGDDYDTADEKGRQMVYIGMDIANNTDFEGANDMGHLLALEKTSFEEFDSIFSNLDVSLIDVFCADAKSRADGLYVIDRGQCEKINELFTDENLDKWKAYIYSTYISSMGYFIPDSSEILSDYFPKSKEAEDDQAASVVLNYLSKQVSEIYTERYYTPELDKGIHDMFDEIIGSYRELIANADWLSADTRKALRKKLDGIRLITAPEPHKVNAKDAKLVGSSLYESDKALTRKVMDDKLELLSSPMDRMKAMMLSTDVNAQYLPCNTINVTVAIMQPPMFDPKGDHAANLGGLGTVMGHEIGHAFDSNCINFSPEGKYDPSWLGEEDKKILDERADVLTDYYSKYTIMEVFHVDGKLTNGENYADLSGVECVTNILDDKEELKKLFESYAKTWCSLSVDSSGIERLKTDEHSPEKIRVNAVLASNKKFNEVYDIKEGDGMYVAPEERVSRW